MSDIAPFVAAAIRDKVVIDQQQEIQNLQAQLEEARRFRDSVMVTITAPDGTVYAEGSLAHRNVDNHTWDGICIQRIYLTSSTRDEANPQLTKYQIQDIDSALIKVGGVPICNLGQYAHMYSETFIGRRVVCNTYHLEVNAMPFATLLGQFISVAIEFGPLPDGLQAGDAGLWDPSNHVTTDIAQVR